MTAEPIQVNTTWEIMIDDFAINYSITEIFDFHFGAGLRNDLFDPAEYHGLARH